MLLSLNTDATRITVTEKGYLEVARMDRQEIVLPPHHHAPRGSLFKSLKAFANAHMHTR